MINFRPLKPIGAIAAAFAFVLSVSDPAAATNGRLSSVAYKPLPAAVSIAVRPWDNSDENLELAKVFETELRARGYRIDPNSEYILAFEIRDILGQWSAGERRNIIELQARGGRTGGEDAKAMLNIFESERGGVLNPGRPTRDVVPSQYQLDVTIDQRGGGRIWQAQATADVPRTRGNQLVRRMIPGLMEALGETVKRGDLNLR